MMMSQQNFYARPRLMIGMVNTVADFSNRDIEKLFDKYNPNGIRSGDIVRVNLHSQKYTARVVGLNLDLKNKKVYADLKLIEQNKKNPTRVDVADCTRNTRNLYPGHHNNG